MTTGISDAESRDEWRRTADAFAEDIVLYLEEIRHLQSENERLRRFETYVCQVIAMGGQASLAVEDLPRV